MPVNLVNSGRRLEYLDPEDDPEFRLQQKAKNAEAIASLAQAYQNFQSNKSDRRLVDELIQESPTGPLAQARQGANNGGGLLNRIRGHFQSGAPLSPMEALIAEQRIKQRYPDPSKGWKPGTREEALEMEEAKARAKAGAFSGQTVPEGMIKVGNKYIKDPKYFNEKNYRRKKQIDRETSATMQDQAKFVNEADKSVDDLDSMLNKVPTGPVKGRFAQAMGKITGGEQNTAGDLFADVKPAAAVFIYRGLTGDTRLSDADAAARAYPLLFDQSESPKKRALKKAFLKRAFSNRKKELASGSSGSDFATVLSDFQDFMLNNGEVSENNNNDLSQMSDEELMKLAGA